jgi:hypothetical protein
MLGYYLQRGNLIGAVVFMIAFILTFWKVRRLCWLAAVFCSIGYLVFIGTEVFARLFTVWIAYGLSDSGQANSIALVFLPLPIAMAGYALASCALFWPGIPQERAIRFGKVLHLIILPIIVLLVFVATLYAFQGEVFGEMKWLVYGPLWFRIREAYGKPISPPV